MIKCPFCHYENEDGALFCERCSSDLSSVAASAPVPPPPPPAPVPVPLSTEPAIPLAVAEPLPVEPLDAIPVAMAEPLPMDAVEVLPVEPLAPPAPPPPPPAPVVEQPPAPPAPAPAPAPAAPVAALPSGAQPRLVVMRGQKRNVEYPIFEGLNYIGRADEKPVDIDLEEQEPPDRIWCSRQHAVISFDSGTLSLEDLNSANGTYVNRTRVYPGQPKTLAVNDVIQIGNVQLKVIS